MLCLSTRSQASGTFDMFLHILQMVSTCEAGVHALGKQLTENKYGNLGGNVDVVATSRLCRGHVFGS